MKMMGSGVRWIRLGGTWCDHAGRLMKETVRGLRRHWVALRRMRVIVERVLLGVGMR
jgi:hypothetical protein